MEPYLFREGRAAATSIDPSDMPLATVERGKPWQPGLSPPITTNDSTHHALSDDFRQVW
jgi:hypothetical protein